MVDLGQAATASNSGARGVPSSPVDARRQHRYLRWSGLRHNIVVILVRCHAVIIRVSLNLPRIDPEDGLTLQIPGVRVLIYPTVLLQTIDPLSVFLCPTYPGHSRAGNCTSGLYSYMKQEHEQLVPVLHVQLLPNDCYY